MQDAVIISGTSDHLLCRVAFRYCLTMRLQWGGTPSCWKKSARSPSNKSSINQFCSVARYASLLTGVPSYKKGRYAHFDIRKVDMAQNTFTLRESHTYYYSIERGCSVPRMPVLCLLISVTWKVASSLNTRRSSNPSSNIALHLGTKAFASAFVGGYWSKCSIYAIIIMQAFSYHSSNGCWRHLKFTTSSSDWLLGIPLEDVSNFVNHFSWNW